MRRLISRVLAVGLIASLAVPASAAAAGKQLSFGLIPVGQPSYFKFKAKPGQVLRGVLQVQSNVTSTRTIRLRPADVGTGSTGGLVFGSGKPHRIGRWVHIRKYAVVPAGGVVSVPFKVTVPRHPGKGQRFAGIVGIDTRDLKNALRNPRPKAGKPLSFKYLPRFGMTVQVNLPGKRKKHVKHGENAVKVTPSGLYIKIPLANDGNTLIESSAGSATISQGDLALTTQPVKIAQFVPGTSIEYLLKVPGQPVEGTYDVSGFLKPAGAPRIALDGSATFGPGEASQFEEQTGREAKGGSSIPWLLIVLLVIFLIVAAFVTRSYLQLRRDRAGPDRSDPWDWQ